MQVKTNKLIIKILLLCALQLFSFFLKGQDTLSKTNYTIDYIKEGQLPVESILFQTLKTRFDNKTALMRYIDSLPLVMESMGYWGASADSVRWQERSATVKLFPGKKMETIKLHFKDESQRIIFERITQKNYQSEKVSFSKFTKLQEQLLLMLENVGYPFASIQIDSSWIEQDTAHVQWNLAKGVYYHIDSIRIIGDAKIDPAYLCRYLDIMPGSAFSKKKILEADALLKKLAFVQWIQPTDITMLGSGGVVNVYLKNRKCSQFNFLLGIQPANSNQQKIQLTGDVLLDLKNLFAKGERIAFKWQQLLPQSPRLDLSWNRPYWMKSPLGSDFQFDLYKKDSVYSLMNARVGVQYDFAATEKFQFFIKWQQSNILSAGTDTQLVKRTKTLPEIIDMSALNMGVSWNGQKTDNPILPVKGNEWQMTVTAGKRLIIKNTEILAIKDTSFNFASLYDTLQLRSYQLTVTGQGAHYFRCSRLSTVKTSLQWGWYQAPAIFKNNLFQIGGYKTLRGFDEESIFASRYLIFSNEYRLLLGNNSYLSFFTDAALTRYQTNLTDNSYRFLSGGTGLLFETKAGLLNICYAIGKRNDVPFSWKNASKIHFGYINYF